MSYTASGVVASSGTGPELPRESFHSTSMQTNQSLQIGLGCWRRREKKRRHEQSTHCERERRQDPTMQGDDRGTLKWRKVFCTDNMEIIEGVTSMGGMSVA